MRSNSTCTNNFFKTKNIFLVNSNFYIFWGAAFANTSEHLILRKIIFQPNIIYELKKCYDQAETYSE